ncbi:MAG: hypothetical protein MK212_09820 [Saprospiraceae bacterium]|nr:hypothetical protein [Saprospiraceae bacterium]
MKKLTYICLTFFFVNCTPMSIYQKQAFIEKTTNYRCFLEEDTYYEKPIIVSVGIPSNLYKESIGKMIDRDSVLRFRAKFIIDPKNGRLINLDPLKHHQSSEKLELIYTIQPLLFEKLLIKVYYNKYPNKAKRNIRGDRRLMTGLVRFSLRRDTMYID